MKLRAPRHEVIEVARGDRSADLYIKNGTVINVYSGEYIKQNVAIYQDTIAYVGMSETSVGKHTKVIDAKGKYISPGFIETHAHPWVLYNPLSLTKKVLPLGTTTTVNDDLFFYLHMGVNGFKEMVRDLKNLPGYFFWLVRLVSQADHPNEREAFSHRKINELLELDEVLGTAEVTRWPLLYQGDPFIIDTINHVKELGKIVDSHNAGCSYEKLNAIAAAGVNADHEAITVKEAHDRLRLGMWTVLRNSSLRPDLPEIIKLITEEKVSTQRILLTTDGPHPSFIDQEGYVDGLVRQAVSLGLSPMQAIQLVTINAATYLRLDEYIGGIAPGRSADLLILPNVTDFKPEVVFSKGRLVGENGKLVVSLPSLDWKKYLARQPFTFPKSALFDANLYRYPCETGKTVPVAHFISTVISKREDLKLTCEDGYVDLSKHKDLLQAALIDRNGTWISRGILKNYGSQIDGMASTYNTTTELLTIGKKHESMALAAARVHELGGGIVIVDDTSIVLEIPLPLTGMMTPSTSFKQSIDYQNQLLKAVQERGYPFHDILYSLLFLTCDFLPGLRLNPFGLYEVKTDSILVEAEPLKNYVK